MSASTVYELIGYLASAFIVTSLTMKSLLKLRLIGLAGSTTFLIYGLLIGAIPIVLVNVVIVFVHLYFLRGLISRRTEYFHVLRVRKESAYLQYFCDFYRAEICKFIPDFRFEPKDDQIRAFILRNTVPAGLFIGDTGPDGAVEVRLDFVTPQFRDFKVGRFLYSARSGLFTGLRTARATAANEAHTAYLQKMGYQPDGERGGVPAFSLDLSPIGAPAA